MVVHRVSRGSAKEAFTKLLALLLLAAQACCHKMCKAYSNNAIFSLSAVHPSFVVLKELTSADGSNYSIFANMCAKLKTDLVIPAEEASRYSPSKNSPEPNVILRKTHPDGKVEYLDIAYFYGDYSSVSNPWSTKVISSFGSKSSLGLEYARILRSENVSTVAIEFNPKSNNEFVAKVLFLNTCFRDPSYDFYDSYYLRDTKTAVFQYSGPKACGEKITNYIAFLSNGYTFVLILGVSALIGLVLDKENERLIMALSSVQASIMAFTSLLFLISGWVSMDSEATKHVYAMLCLLCASVSFGLSYFHRVTSLAFVCVSVSYAIVWTLLYLIMLVFRQNISTVVQLTGNIVVICVIVLVSTWSVKIREKYSYYLYTAVTNSFYLCLAVFVKFENFLDIVNFNKFKDYGKEEKLQFSNWYFILVQSLLTSVAVYRQVRQGRKLTRKHNEKSRGGRLVSERVTTNENDFFGEQKHVNETLIAM